MDRHAQVMEAARELVAAFARNDTEAYFAAFSEDASFLFHTTPGVLQGRAAYRELWDAWQREGFRVLGCESRNPLLSLQGDVAIFMHEVVTRLRVGGEAITSLERRPSSSANNKNRAVGWPVTSTCRPCRSTCPKPDEAPRENNDA